MGKQLLIYENAVPVSSERHRNWSVRTGDNYAYASKTNAVPLMAVEFPVAAMEYAIVFTGSDQAIVPAVIMGLRNDENVFLSPTGEWQAKYIPAYVRRYPFVFSTADEGKNFTLCIDEQFSGCNQQGRGERLFDADGKRTQYLESVLEFVRQYQLHFQRTLVFCKKLDELNLLEPMQADMTLGDGQKISLAGFRAVNRDKLKALPGAQLEDLAKSDELELIFIHLQSMRNFPAMGERMRDAIVADERVAPKPSTPEQKQVKPAGAGKKH
jgi:hypothetical protein